MLDSWGAGEDWFSEELDRRSEKLDVAQDEEFGKDKWRAAKRPSWKSINSRNMTDFIDFLPCQSETPPAALQLHLKRNFCKCHKLVGELRWLFLTRGKQEKIDTARKSISQAHIVLMEKIGTPLKKKSPFGCFVSFQIEHVDHVHAY